MKFPNPLMDKMVKKIMLHGKLELACKIFTKALERTHAKLFKESNVKLTDEELFLDVLKKGSPTLGVKTKKFRGSNCQVPVPLNTYEGNTRCFSYIINTIRKKKGSDTITKLSNILFETYKEQGDIIKLKNESHKQSESQKAFAHLTHLFIKA